MSTVMAVAALLAGVNITSVNAAAIMIDGVNAGYANSSKMGVINGVIYTIIITLAI